MYRYAVAYVCIALYAVQLQRCVCVLFMCNQQIYISPAWVTSPSGFVAIAISPYVQLWVGRAELQMTHYLTIGLSYTQSVIHCLGQIHYKVMCSYIEVTIKEHIIIIQQSVYNNKNNHLLRRLCNTVLLECFLCLWMYCIFSYLFLSTRCYVECVTANRGHYRER